ncbi:rhomboid-domain-containing protein [Yamadazyma tenuis ATCC 10573]|uniref:Rhomboid-type serine protease n=2 Tax=Candida tenuis TaxID=2315449 RepID=G3B2N1_CANTC|nr:rhomboid-domain-containing protein [Yamadazyma tenuis ATCC 10573]EGV64721.1 rhomboid-domain-containing protein [Yamadazyma tenuis ATCC 10573]
MNSIHSSPVNPFSNQNDYDRYEDKKFQHQQYPYDESPTLHQNPFENPPVSYIPDKAQPPIPDYDEEKKLKHNERQRLKQLRSRPRFHYTRLPYFGILVTIIQVVVFIVELAKMAKLTGSAFQTKPYFNPMLGPSTYVLINMGARYIPCMNGVEGITTDPSIQYPCPNSTSVDTDVCSLNQLCGLSGIPIVDDAYDPHQWYRIITPIFIHAGFLHILFNLLLQVTMGFSIERAIGSVKYAIIYLLSGVSGFLLGANFTPNGVASSGASGSLFGIVATNIVMFIYCGKKNTNMYGTKKFGLFLCIMFGEIVVSFVLGLLPGLDNFSHIGGFAIGVLSSILLLKDPFFVYEDGIITYQSHLSIWQEFANNWNPYYNFEDKIVSRFYIWCGVRVLCFALIFVYFALLINNFFGKSILPEENSCHWCKYISCLPVNGWCEQGELSVQTNSADDNSQSTTASATTSTPTSATSTEPDSIDNTGFSEPNKRETVLDSVFESSTFENSTPLLGRHEESIHASLALFIIMGLFTFTALKFKKKQ